MSSFRLAHTFAATSAALSVCAVAVPLWYRDWADSILWLAAAAVCAMVARNETREVRAYRRWQAQRRREAERRQFYAQATTAENEQGLT